MSRKINVPEKVLYSEWSAQAFWFKHLYLAWQSYYDNEYRRIKFRELDRK